MKITTNLDKLTPEQEKLLESIESKLNVDDLAYRCIDEDKAWEQWCDKNEDAFTTHRYSGGWNTPPGAIFEEVDGPEGFEDVGEDEMWETYEGEDSYAAAETVVEFFKRNIDEILTCEDIGEFLDTRYEELMEKVLEDYGTDKDGDDIYSLVEHVLY